MSRTDHFKSPHHEQHRSHRAAWLRAAVLGVNDGTVSTASLMLGVLAASQNDAAILTAGIAGLAAGALSMAAGEYVSVSSQRDSEQADIAIEKKSLKEQPEKELAELAWIYEKRGLDARLALTVAEQLQKHEGVAAHARDELNIEYGTLARPVQAALASAVAFSIGAIVPIIAALLTESSSGGWYITASSLVALAISGAIGASIGGGQRVVAALRVFLGGGAAMAITYLIGHFVGVAV